MKLRRRVPDYTTPDWVHSLEEGAGPFWRKTFKNDGKFGFGSPYMYLPSLLRKSGSVTGLL
jgi:hypothetical protein